MLRRPYILIVALISFIVNAGPLAVQAKPPDAKAAQKVGRIKALIARLRKEGENRFFFKGELADNIDIPKGAPMKTDGYSREETTDDLERYCDLIVEKSENGEIKPTWLIFDSRKDQGQDSETHLCRAALDGTLEKCVLQRGKLDENGKPVRGSGVLTVLDVKDPAVVAGYRHELDFWLKGKYRKKK